MFRFLCNLQAAVTGNVTNIVNFARNAALNAPVEDAIAAVSKALGYVATNPIFVEAFIWLPMIGSCWHSCRELCMCRANLDTLVAGGARKIIVWGFVAVEQVPIVQLVNKYVNVLDRFFGGEPKDSTVQYGTKVVVRHHCHMTVSGHHACPFTLPVSHDCKSLCSRYTWNPLYH